MAVEITVTVVEVKGRAVTLGVEARDALDAICRGKHHRFVVDVNATKARLAAKAEKAEKAAKGAVAA
jgi:predicted thioesterase